MSRSVVSRRSLMVGLGAPTAGGGWAGGGIDGGWCRPQAPGPSAGRCTAGRDHTDQFGAEGRRRLPVP